MRDVRHGSESESFTLSRRALFGTVIGVVTAGAGFPRQAAAMQESAVSAQRDAVKALVFDVFGTVVDWRTSVAAQVEELAKRKGLKVDGAAFADAWRAPYTQSMNRVRTGELPWTTLDRLHRRRSISCCQSSASRASARTKRCH